MAITNDAEPITDCPCNHGWMCEEHPDKPWEHDDCGGAGELCKNSDFSKNPDSIFALKYSSRTSRSPRRDRQKRARRGNVS
jgi:hypothetical protein